MWVVERGSLCLNVIVKLWLFKLFVTLRQYLLESRFNMEFSMFNKTFWFGDAIGTARACVVAFRACIVISLVLIGSARKGLTKRILHASFLVYIGKKKKVFFQQHGRIIRLRLSPKCVCDLKLSTSAISIAEINFEKDKSPACKSTCAICEHKNFVTDCVPHKLQTSFLSGTSAVILLKKRWPIIRVEWNRNHIFRCWAIVSSNRPAQLSHLAASRTWHSLFRRFICWCRVWRDYLRRELRVLK